MRKALIAIILLTLTATGATWGFLAAIQPTRLREPRVIAIQPGESFRSVAQQLAAAGVVRSAALFVVYGEWSGRAGRVKPGDYAFPGGESLNELLERLVEGDFLTITVAIPEGLTVHQIGQRLQAAGLVCDGEFDAEATDGPLLRALGLGTFGAEGFLFPATYRFSPRARTDDLLAAMLAEFFARLTPPIEQRMFDLGLDAREVVTLASIIEREAKVAGERPVIASVFYNRLAAGMPLQSDPTAQYNFTGERPAARAAVHTASAYNTYAIVGLPPGPIANPGWPAIAAALYPAHTDYLYFVARDDGTHIFSRSFREHQRAVEELRSAAWRSPRHAGH
ncbi:MAG TPA: endolytic transglycosylase MltG [Candidatus Binataceae bacterium]|nr:endolytic transglycosylase MltG [Candidatus Binataceae bacterium]